MRLTTIALAVLVCLGAASPSFASRYRAEVRARRDRTAREICPGYRFEERTSINFNDNEKKLICGDPNAVSWRDIPRFQAEYFITVFLQERGYYYPRFSLRDGGVVVDPGPQLRVNDIAVAGSPPPFFDVTRRRNIMHEPLTPDRLTTLENWTKSVLKDNGYPCPDVTATADAVTGFVTLTVRPGPYQRIVDVDEEPVEGLRPGTLARYRAFNLGDPYDAQDLALTSRRITQDGILQSSYLLTDCKERGAALTQKSMAGPKRLLRVGVGASTEDYVIGKLQLKWNRIGMNGSSIELSLRGSYHKQWLNAQGFIYPLPYPTRWHLNPFVTTQRHDESQFEYTEFNVALPAAVTWETRHVGYRLRFGPKVMYTNTQRGAQGGDTRFISLAAWLDVASHGYEYFIADPRTGYRLNTMTALASDKLGSSVTAQRFQLTGQALWNIGAFEPPLFILGIRGLVGTTLTDTGDPSFARLPPQFLYYLGGSPTLRGFARYSLPGGARGALTALYAGMEGRLANFIPLNFQPLALFDIAALGQTSFDIDFPLYGSAGFGVRWPSRIGVFRVTLAYGFLMNNANPANNRLEQWKFFWSFGEEF